MKTTEELIAEETSVIQTHCKRLFGMDCMQPTGGITSNFSFLMKFVQDRLSQVALHAREGRDRQLMEMLPAPATHLDCVDSSYKLCRRNAQNECRCYSDGFNTCRSSVKALLSPKKAPMGGVEQWDL